MAKKPFSPHRMTPLTSTALAMFLAAPVVVSAATTTIDTPTFGTVNINSGDSLVVTSSGSISTAPSTAVIINSSAGSITNDGTITGYSGIFVNSGGDISGGITNNATGIIQGSYHGIVADGNLSGAIVNHGTIQGSYYDAIVVNGTWSNSLTNDGVISAAVTDASATVFAVDVGAMSGNITNSGTLSASVDATWFANAGGINIYTLTGNLTNGVAGTISASAHAPSSRAYAMGVDIKEMTGTFTNSGNISASATGNWASATAVGITTMNGDITNSGTISATSTGYASGIFVGNMSGNLSNSDSITVTASNWADGIRVISMNGNLSNSGDITSNFTGVGAAIWYGDITNEVSGAINAGSKAVYIDGGMEGKFTNNGTITTTVGNGVSINDNAGLTTAAGTSFALHGDFVNNGLIEAGGNGVIINGNLLGNITNNGTINAVNTGIAVLGDVTGTITNSGTINANGAAWCAIRYSGTGAGTVNQNAGTINGNISLGSGDDTLNINGGSVNGKMDGRTGSDTLNINTSLVLGDYVSNFEAVNINSGTTDLNGINISGGSNVTIAGGAGMIMNRGRVVASVTNNGTMDVGSGTGIITGNYTQTAGSTTQFDIYNSTTASRLLVGNKATLGHVEAHVSGDGYIADGSNYSVLQAPNNPIDTTQLTLSDNSAVLDFTASGLGAKTLYLTAHRVATYQSLAGSNYSNLAGQLDAIGASGSYTTEQQALLGALDASPTADALTQKLADWSPDSTGAALGGSREVAAQVSDMVGQRLDSQLASAGQSGMAAGDGFRNSGVWLQGFSGNSKQEGSLGNNGYDGTNNGFVIGADTAVGSSSRIGLSLASTKNSLDIASGAVADTLDIKSNHVTLYGSYDAGKWNVAGMLASSKHDYDSVRNGINSASYSGSQLGMMVEGAYPIQMAGIDVVPVVSISHATLDLDGYTESGPGALTVDGASYSSNELGLGARLSKEIQKGNLTWVPRGSLRYKHESGDVKQETSATLTSAGISFATASTERKRGTMELGLGVDMLSGDRVALQADYQLDSRSDYKANTYRLKLRYSF